MNKQPDRSPARQVLNKKILRCSKFIYSGEANTCTTQNKSKLATDLSSAFLLKSWQSLLALNAHTFKLSNGARKGLQWKSSIKAELRRLSEKFMEQSAITFFT